LKESGFIVEKETVLNGSYEGVVRGDGRESLIWRESGPKPQVENAF